MHPPPRSGHSNLLQLGLPPHSIPSIPSDCHRPLHPHRGEVPSILSSELPRGEYLHPPPIPFILGLRPLLLTALVCTDPWCEAASEQSCPLHPRRRAPLPNRRGKHCYLLMFVFSRTRSHLVLEHAYWPFQIQRNPLFAGAAALRPRHSSVHRITLPRVHRSQSPAFVLLPCS